MDLFKLIFSLCFQPHLKVSFRGCRSSFMEIRLTLCLLLAWWVYVRPWQRQATAMESPPPPQGRAQSPHVGPDGDCLQWVDWGDQSLSANLPHASSNKHTTIPPTSLPLGEQDTNFLLEPNGNNIDIRLRHTQKSPQHACFQTLRKCFDIFEISLQLYEKLSGRQFSVTVFIMRPESQFEEHLFISATRVELE